MYSSMILLALSSTVVTASLESDLPRWFNDYSSAVLQSQKEMKPVAVFVGSGPNGWAAISKEAKLGPEIQSVLNSSYICYYANSDSEAGRQAAASFRIGEGTGLVISDRTARQQAFWHQGKLTGPELEAYLRKYARSDHVVVTTETHVKAEVRYYAPAPQIPIYQPAMTGGC